MANVVFQFENGEKVTATMAGENLLETLRKSNVVIDAPCSGNGSLRKVSRSCWEAENWIPRRPAISMRKSGRRAGVWPVEYGSRRCAGLVPDIASAYKSRMKVADLSYKKKIKILTTAWSIWQRPI